MAGARLGDSSSVCVLGIRELISRNAAGTHDVVSTARLVNGALECDSAHMLKIDCSVSQSVSGLWVVWVRMHKL